MSKPMSIYRDPPDYFQTFSRRFPNKTLKRLLLSYVSTISYTQKPSPKPKYLGLAIKRKSLDIASIRPTLCVVSQLQKAAIDPLISHLRRFCLSHESQILQGFELLRYLCHAIQVRSLQLASNKSTSFIKSRHIKSIISIYVQVCGKNALQNTLNLFI